MIATLHRLLAAPETHRQLVELAAGAPASAVLSLRLPLPGAPADWLALLPGEQPWWYRARPQRGEYRLAIGHALQLVSAGPNRFAALDNAFNGVCRDWRRNGPALAFAGFAFDTRNDQPLPNALLAIPGLLLESRDGQCALTLSTTAGRLAQSLAEWPGWLHAKHPAETGEMLPCRAEPLADRAWMARVIAALRDMGRGQFDKVVLSRNRRITSTQAFSARRILARLNAQQPASVVYGHGHGQLAFLGASPERLVGKQGRRIRVDVLVGTAWPGSLALAEGKNRHEQSLVVRAICEALAPCCAAAPEVGDLEEHAAGQLRHWRSRIRAQALGETTLFDLLRALHPTPAVGGFPAAAAQTWLDAHHEKRNGWYSGGFGMLTPEGDGEFSVALRSALLDGCTAELQAGAGIVAGSDPEQELAETEAKFGTLLAALGGTPARHSRCA